jgi:hypothetical protein
LDPQRLRCGPSATQDLGVAEAPVSVTSLALSRWARGVLVVTVLAATSCAAVHEMSPNALHAPVSASDTSMVGSSLKPGRWYFFRGYTESRGPRRSASGRVRIIPGDSLEFETHISSSASLAPTSHRSVVPRDSIGELLIFEPDARQTLVVVGSIAVCLIWLGSRIP